MNGQFLDCATVALSDIITVFRYLRKERQHVISIVNAGLHLVLISKGILILDTPVGLGELQTPSHSKHTVATNQSVLGDASSISCNSKTTICYFVGGIAPREPSYPRSG